MNQRTLYRLTLVPLTAVLLTIIGYLGWQWATEGQFQPTVKSLTEACEQLDENQFKVSVMAADLRTDGYALEFDAYIAPSKLRLHLLYSSDSPPSVSIAKGELSLTKASQGITDVEYVFADGMIFGRDNGGQVSGSENRGLWQIVDPDAARTIKSVLESIGDLCRDTGDTTTRSSVPRGAVFQPTASTLLNTIKYSRTDVLSDSQIVEDIWFDTVSDRILRYRETWQAVASSGSTSTTTRGVQEIKFSDIGVANVIVRPEFARDSYTFSLDSGASTGIVVGIVAVIDSSAYVSSTYSITAGNESNIFAIQADTGQISVSGQLPSQATRYNLIVSATKKAGGVSTASVTVEVG